MTAGIVFDIKEFAVHDGPGIRTTVFLKGCPLACMWCHNPESQSIQIQTMHSPTGDRIAGRVFDAPELAALLNRQATILRANEGGVTFSGGEPLLQAAFVAEVIDRLDNLHVVVDTAGYAPKNALSLLLRRTNLFYYDLKLIDPVLHRHYTGYDNQLILNNLHAVSASGTPFVVRVPLIPGVTDTPANLNAIVETVRGLPGLVRVDLLPYNRTAGGKYAAAGKVFQPDYDENAPVNADVSVFERAGLPVRVA